MAGQVLVGESCSSSRAAGVPVTDERALAVLVRFYGEAGHGQHIAGHLLALARFFTAVAAFRIAPARIVINAGVLVIVFACVANRAARSRIVSGRLP